MKTSSTNRSLAALSAVAAALLVVSGIPAFKDSDGGWKHLVGDLSWGGFLVTAVALIAVAVTVLVRRRRAAV
jgi:biotin transporter BioY